MTYDTLTVTQKLGEGSNHVTWHEDMKMVPVPDVNCATSFFSLILHCFGTKNSTQTRYGCRAGIHSGTAHGMTSFLFAQTSELVHVSKIK